MVSATQAYALDSVGTLHVLDISDPDSPKQTATFDLGSVGSALAVSGNTVCVIAGGLQVIDVTDSINPKRIGALPGIGADGLGSPRLVISGHTVYVAGVDAASPAAPGLLVVDISDLASPKLIGQYDSPNPMAVAMRGTSVCLVSSKKVGMLDVTTPSTPSLLAQISSAGLCRGIAISGDRAFVLDEILGLVVLDLSQISSPTWAGKVAVGGYACDVAVFGNYACIADQNAGLEILEISNLRAPRLVASYDTGTGQNYAMAVAVSGSHAYVADPLTGLSVIDLSEPGNPQQIGSYTNVVDVRKVVISGNYAYLADYYYGLRIVNISDPTRPLAAGQAPSTRINDLVVAGKYAYTVGGAGSPEVYDISNPPKPVRLGYRSAPAGNAVAASGNYVYVATQSGYLEIVDISTPAKPLVVASFALGISPAVGVTVSRGTAYVTAGPGRLILVDISNVLAPRRIGQYYYRAWSYPPGKLGGPVVRGDIVFVPNGGAGLEIADTSILANPQPVTNVAVSFAKDVAISGTLACVANHPAGLITFDISNPSNPRYLGTNAIGVDCIAMANSTVCAGSGTGSLMIVDVSSPSQPKLLGSADTGATIQSVALSGTYAYAASEDVGLQIFDISTPSTLQLLGTITNAGATKVALSGPYALLASPISGLSVLNVSNPTKPKIVSHFGQTAWDVALADHYAYVAGYDGFQVLDIADPSAPTLLGALSGVECFAVTVESNHAYVRSGPAGLRIIDISDPANPRWMGGNSAAAFIGSIGYSAGRIFLSSGAGGLAVLELKPFFRSFERRNGKLQIDWEGFGPTVLQSASHLDNADWSNVTTSVSTNSYSVPTPITNIFFRLGRP